MKRIKFLCLLLFLATFAAGVVVYDIKKVMTPRDDEVQNLIKNPQLREDILRRMKSDQVMQKELFSRFASGQDLPLELFEKHKAAEAENAEWIKRVFEQNGYPSYSLVGKDGSDAANFLFIQHIKGDLPFQKKALELVRKAVEKSDASPDLLASLTDRILVAEGKPQVYGTSLRSNNGTLEPSPIEDKENVDKRRNEIGLAPLADSIKMAQREVPRTKS